ncbi:VOC family protein [Dactylosporangium sp. CA-139114]|uniref:VOC family protein n=1 Tax=Dactylosporangium sp. CA-139114 TaxID=3239931 RepID=UPI003D976FC6
MTGTAPSLSTRAVTGIPGAQRVDHIALTVPDLDAAVAFAVGTLGGRVAYRLPPLTRDDDWMRDKLDVHPRASAEIALVRLGPRTNLELFEYRAPDHDPVPPPPSRPGCQILGLAVDDVEAAAAALVAGGARPAGPVLTAPPCAPQAGTRSMRLIAPWGLPIDLRTTPGSLPYERETAARRCEPEPYWTNRDDGRPEPSPVPGLRCVDHVGYTVADLDAAIAVWTGVLGAELLYRTGGAVEHAALRLGPTDNLELTSPPGAAGSPPRNSDVGGRHLAIHVEDVDAAAAYLAAQPGFTVLGEPQTIPDGPIAGDRWVYVRSPLGLHIELVRMPDGALPYERESAGRRRAAGDLRWTDR